MAQQMRVGDQVSFRLPTALASQYDVAAGEIVTGIVEQVQGSASITVRRPSGQVVTYPQWALIGLRATQVSPGASTLTLARRATTTARAAGTADTADTQESDPAADVASAPKLTGLDRVKRQVAARTMQAAVKAPYKPRLNWTDPKTPTSARVHVTLLSAATMLHIRPGDGVAYDFVQALPQVEWSKKAQGFKGPATATFLSHVQREGQVALGAGAILFDADAQMMLDQLAAKTLAQTIKSLPEAALTQPPFLRTQMWPHQKRATMFANQMPNGCGIYMDLGTGKTLVAMGTMTTRQAQRILVVCPKKVVDNVWPQELAKHIDREMVICALGDKKRNTAQKVALAEQALADAARRGVPCVIIVNYETAFRAPFGPRFARVVKTSERSGRDYTVTRMQEPGFACSQTWDMVVLDEAHRIKNPQSQTAKFCHELRNHTTYRLALTGTPVGHDAGDMYAQFAFFAPEVVGSWSKFQQRYLIVGGPTGKQVVGMRAETAEELQTLIEQHSFRVTKDILRLPPQHFTRRYVTLSDEERRAYRDMEHDLIVHLNDDKLVTAANALAASLRCMQVANGFVGEAETKQEYDIGTSKLDALADVLADLDEDEPIVVFAVFRHDIERIRRLLDSMTRSDGTRRFRTGELSGRADDLSAFKTGAVNALVVQIKSGGAGIDLTQCGAVNCHYCIYYSEPYQWLDWDQSKSRVHRPGQKLPTIYITLHAEDTIDDDIQATLEARTSLGEFLLAKHRTHTVLTAPETIATLAG